MQCLAMLEAERIKVYSRTLGVRQTSTKLSTGQCLKQKALQQEQNKGYETDQQYFQFTTAQSRMLTCTAEQVV